MKKTKLIIPAMGILLLSAAASATGTVAWFTVSKTVSATGMKVRAQAPGNLVITTGALPTETTTSVSINYASELMYLLPSTYDDSSTTDLKYVTNSDNINAKTGTQKDDASTLLFENAENNSSDNIYYYEDFTAYIASAGSELKNQDLTIKLTGTALTNINGAMSVAFYINTQTNTANAAFGATNYNYVASLNYAGVDAALNDTTAKTEIVLSDITIPAAKTTGGKAIGIVMRVYYDGALLSKKAGVDGSGNPVTKYVQCGESETATASGDYYELVGSAYKGVSVPQGASVKNYFTIDANNSSYAYCRTASVADLANVDMGISFTADVHA